MNYVHRIESENWVKEFAVQHLYIIIHTPIPPDVMYDTESIDCAHFICHDA